MESWNGIKRTHTVCYIRIPSQNEYLTEQLNEETKKERPLQCLRRGSDQKTALKYYIGQRTRT